MTIYEDDFCVRLIALPYSIHALTRVDVDGFYNIYINALLPYSMQSSAFWHEILHIQRGDFWGTRGIRSVESA